MTSPIERMIDEACGVAKPVMKPKNKGRPQTEYAKAVEAVLDLACEWYAAPKHRKKKAIEDLGRAVGTMVEIENAK